MSNILWLQWRVLRLVEEALAEVLEQGKFSHILKQDQVISSLIVTTFTYHTHIEDSYLNPLHSSLLGTFHILVQLVEDIAALEHP